WEDENLDAILETWFSGTMSGPALTDILFGDANPSGKISMSFPRNVGQVPIYYNHKNTGRPPEASEKYRSKYLDVSNDPLYPFGYGLSYTNFSYGPLKLSKRELSPGQTLTASISVGNSGDRDGAEIVQLYTQDLLGSISRPVKELKGFQKIFLKAGETKIVEFKISSEDLRFYNSDLKFVSEPGDFKVFVGSNSRDLKEAEFSLLK
ncbi:MAG: fibronectin type III-like domain-contianing protein, partial [Candidatus Obscuribacterales bacterium]|nr:fibronectin type III-like domain-contianing protein [Candidatus Obscuribacterales bacterium]